ncbi:hypothetical protein BsWGS_01692 [Bradybaena similaris]
MSTLDQLSINIVSHLEKKPGICQVKHDVKPAAEKPAISMWEQKHSLLLPVDLRNFFLTTNGFHLTWSVKMENAVIPVGVMHINSVGQLQRLENALSEGTHTQPSLWDLEIEDQKDEKKAPSFVESKIFELDPCDRFGKVCLVYSGAPKDYITKIWFLDRSLRWHYICDTFLAYYRLMLMHLGLPHWQFAFTDIGLPPYAKQWYNMYAPVRLEVDAERGVDLTTHNEMSEKAKTSPLDVNKVFKEQSDQSKAAGTQNVTNVSRTGPKKQKPIMPSARSSTSVGKQAGQSSSQMTIKSSR